MIELVLSGLASRRGEEIAVSEWVEVAQSRIDLFADAIEDRHWIHVDPARAAAESSFGTTIAHGFLTLSLVSLMFQRAMRIEAAMGINYGVNHVRFVAPVPAGARVRGRFRPVALQSVPGGTQVTWNVVVERDGSDKPCCSLEWIVRYYPPAAHTNPAAGS